MPVSDCADVIVYVCNNCVSPSARLPRQWRQNELRVQAQMTPCSGKLDVQYLMHAFEGGVKAVCVFACPQGECHLAQGNYRAEIRVATVQRLLNEIGMEANRILLKHCPADVSSDDLERIVRETVEQLTTSIGKPAVTQAS
ncbi:hydrogenase iron-sulfur subunit [Candidatus Sumerlaeota bacterium]|nr:hydrogenase iron-sulfur subunit [Candidatus Sumerlaeota bacterium]